MIKVVFFGLLIRSNSTNLISIRSSGRGCSTMSGSIAKKLRVSDRTRPFKKAIFILYLSLFWSGIRILKTKLNLVNSPINTLLTPIHVQAGIIEKLKEYDCYIDNDLPDYIMVLIANKKSSSQMKEDLSLFVGDHVSEYVDWLHHCLDEIKVGNDPFVKPESKADDKKQEILVSREDGPVKNLVRKEVVRPKPQTVESTSLNSSTSLTKLNKTSSNEECKENTKDKPAAARMRKEITFTNEDKIKYEDSKKYENKIKHEDKIKHENKIKYEDSKKSVDVEAPKKSQHKRIVYSEERDNLPTKRFRTQITIDSQKASGSSSHYETNLNDRSLNSRRMETSLHSQANYKQHHQQQPNLRISNLQSSNYHMKSISSNQYSPQHGNYSQHNYHPNHPSTNFSAGHYKPINQQNEIRHRSPQPVNQQQHKPQQQQHMPQQQHHMPQQQQHMPQQQQHMPQQQQHMPQAASSVIQKFVKKEVRADRSNQKSLIMKAVEEANKQSNLPSISLRKSDSESPPKALINRLGIASASTKIVESNSQPSNDDSTKLIDRDDDARKSRRLAKFNTIEIRKPIESSKPELIKPDEANSELKPDDLRFRLGKKRKPEIALSVGQNALKKISPNRLGHVAQVNSSKDIENDEELRKLRNEIKPKTVLAENKKDENKKDADDSDENIKVIIKRDLLERMKQVQATVDEQKNKLKLSKGKDTNVSSTRRERCLYWPLCTNQDCQYHHPKALCA